MLHFKIKRAKVSDAPLLLSIEQATENKTYSTIKNLAQAVHYLQTSTILWLYSAKELIGKISYHTTENNCIEISGLIILPAYRQKGYGKYLVNYLLQLFPDHAFSLTVHPENIAAIRIYESLEFQSVSIIKNFYGGKEPRLLMIRNQSGHQI